MHHHVLKFVILFLFTEFNVFTSLIIGWSICYFVFICGNGKLSIIMVSRFLKVKANNPLFVCSFVWILYS